MSLQSFASAFRRSCVRSFAFQKGEDIGAVHFQVKVRRAHGAPAEPPTKLSRVDINPPTPPSIDDRIAHMTSTEGRSRSRFSPPPAPPPKDKDIEALSEFVESAKCLLVLTGAGVSTESGIPDYRSPRGAYNTGFKPITHQEFVRSAANRSRYWARSYAGWRTFSQRKPGETHRALAKLEQRGRVAGGMITQNVDRLHHAAGSTPLELHGTTHRVVCLACGSNSDRQEFQDRVAALNPDWAAAVDTAEDEGRRLQRPDGDVEIASEFLTKGLFKVPPCQTCGSDTVKPDVVFFGDNVPVERSQKAAQMVAEADALLVVGSSVSVLSAFRLVRAASEQGSPVAIVNLGTTRADDLAKLKIEARTGEVFMRLLATGSMDVPVG